jgi:hypothetical protein
MSPTKTEVISDPLFQLNVLLWLTQPLAEASAITPLLYQRGFSVYAISPALTGPFASSNSSTASSNSYEVQRQAGRGTYSGERAQVCVRRV